MSSTAERYPVPKDKPTYTSAERRVSGRHRTPLWDKVAAFFVVVAFVLVAWFAWELLDRGVPGDPAWALYLVAFWAIAAYLALPRMHQVFTVLYVPDYFIGRTRTSDGILGDPVNLAFDGTEHDIHAAMQAAGWTLADDITLRSSWKIVQSSVMRRSYPEAPVSDLHLFGRKQAFAYQQEVDGNPSQRHHVRFWPVPEGWYLPGGQRVDFLAAGTYDRSVGLSGFTGQVTHKIDANTDAERDYIINTLRYAKPNIGVRVIEKFSTAYHSRNGGGDAIQTDGHLPVVNVKGLVEELPAPEYKDEDTTVARHHIPPMPLLGTGVLAIFSAIYELSLVLLSDHPPISIVGAILSVGLWALTAARFRWAWVALMASSVLACITRLLFVGEQDFQGLVNAGVSVLVVLAVSASSVRKWVRK